MPSRTALSVVTLSVLISSAIASQPVVVIDPGHPAGPHDAGERGAKLWEAEENFRVAAALAQKLTTQGVKAILTKSDLRLMLTNKRRAEIANWAKADLFIRIHCDQTTGSGYTVVYPNAMGTTPEGDKGPTQHIINASAAAAKLFHKAMAAALKDQLVDNGIKTDAQTPVGAKQGALTGSIYSKVPTFLVDMVVLKNPEDEAWMSKPKNVPKMVDAIDKGILAVLGIEAD